MSFKSIAWGIVKIQVIMLVLSVLAGFLNYFVYFLSVNSLANDMALRVSSYNFLYQSDYNTYKNALTDSTTYLGRFSGDTPSTGSYLTIPNPDVTPLNITAVWNPSCGGDRSAIIADNYDLDNPSKICTTYDSKKKIDVDKFSAPNRGEVVRINLNTSMKMEMYTFGIKFVAKIPISISKVATPLQYYRW